MVRLFRLPPGGVTQAVVVPAVATVPRLGAVVTQQDRPAEAVVAGAALRRQPRVLFCRRTAASQRR